jgi:lipopolysaccharide cholinephosphotransferase
VGKKYISTDKMKEIELDILKHFKKYCNEHNLTFYLAYGTLLGAVRHKGFIPWDDDIDVIMPRPDYDYLIENYVDPTGKYSFICFENNKNYYLPFGKIMDNRTVLDEHFRCNCLLGVYIDVYPIDACPKGCLTKEVDKARRFFSWAHELTYKQNDTFKEKLAITGLNIISFWASTPYLMGRMVKTARKTGSYDTAERVGILSGSLGNLPMGKKLLGKPIDMAFEDTQMPIPRGYDEILKGWYGDYMKLPPENKRTTTHTKHTVWWKEQNVQ